MITAVRKFTIDALNLDPDWRRVTYCLSFVSQTAELASASKEQLS